MYATLTSSSASVYGSRNSSSLYRQIGLETGVSSATPHQLIVMLLNGALEAIAQARGAIKTNQLEAKRLVRLRNQPFDASQPPL